MLLKQIINLDRSCEQVTKNVANLGDQSNFNPRIKLYLSWWNLVSIEQRVKTNLNDVNERKNNANIVVVQIFLTVDVE